MPPSSPPPVDFLGIQAFLAVAECGSFGLAAQRLHLSQTAISHRMRKLEENLGAANVELTSDDLRAIDAALSQVAVQGARYADHLQRMVDR